MSNKKAMKAKDLIKILEERPNASVCVMCGEKQIPFLISTHAHMAYTTLLIADL